MKKYEKAKKLTLRMLPLFGMVAALTVLVNVGQMKMMNVAPPFPMPVMIAGMALQSLVTPVVLCFLGQILSEKAGLWKSMAGEPKAKRETVISGVVLGILMGVSETMFFMPELTKQFPDAMGTIGKPSLMAALYEVLQGGIVEEVTARLFLMSLTVVLLWKIFAGAEEKAPVWTVAVADVIAALLFTAGHLATFIPSFGWTPLIIVRCLLLDGVTGMVYGWLYGKNGLPCSMQAHMAAEVVKYVIFMMLL